jgi:hypothetical protein
VPLCRRLLRPQLHGRLAPSRRLADDFVPQGKTPGSESTVLPAAAAGRLLLLVYGLVVFLYKIFLLHQIFIYQIFINCKV